MLPQQKIGIVSSPLLSFLQYLLGSLLLQETRGELYFVLTKAERPKQPRGRESMHMSLPLPPPRPGKNSPPRKGGRNNIGKRFSGKEAGKGVWLEKAVGGKRQEGREGREDVLGLFSDDFCKAASYLSPSFLRPWLLPPLE